MATRKTASPVQDLGRLLSTKEAADRLGLEPNDLYQMRHHNEGPESIVVGRARLRWPERGIEKYLAAQRAATSRGGRR